MAKSLAPLLVMLLTLPTSAFAQSVIKTQPEGNRPLVASAFAAARELAVSVAPASRVPAAQVASVPKSWPARHPVLLGALIGLAVGGVAGGAAEFCPGYSYSEGVSGNCRVEGVIWGAGAGAGVGALIGKLFSRE